MKKILTLLLALVMVCSLTACNRGETMEEPENTAEKTNVKIGFSVCRLSDEFMAGYCNEVEAYLKLQGADASGYELTVADSSNNSIAQLLQVEDFVAEGVDLVILELVETSQAKDIVEKVTQAGIPLILIRREPDAKLITGNPGVSYVGPEELQAYACQGELLAALENRGDINGDKKVSCLVLGNGAEADLEKRTKACLKVLTDGGMETEILAKIDAGGDPNTAKTLCADALKEYEQDLEVIFCQGDALTRGAAEAVAEAERTVGTDIYLVGLGTSGECISLVRSGNLTGLVMDDCVAQAHTAVDAAVAILAGEAQENYYRVDYMKVAG